MRQHLSYLLEAIELHPQLRWFPMLLVQHDLTAANVKVRGILKSFPLSRLAESTLVSNFENLGLSLDTAEKMGNVSQFDDAGQG